MKTHASDFLNHLIVERGYAKNTQETYGRTLKRFIAFAATSDITKAEEVDYGLVEKFLSHLFNLGLNSTSVRLFLGSLKSFFRFLKTERVIASNPVANIPSPKIERKLPTVLTLAEVKLVLNQPKEKSFSGSRDRAFLELLYGSGLRISEACFLKMEDIQGDFVLVNGKGSKQRLVPTSSYFRESLQKYYERYRMLKGGDYVFTSRSNDKPVTRIQMYTMIQVYAAKSNISKGISPHTFRHTFAVHLLNNGADIRIIQELLGHSSIQTTGIYLNISRNAVMKSFKRYHPRYRETCSSSKQKIEEFYLETAIEALNEFGSVSPTLLQRRLKITLQKAEEICQFLECVMEILKAS